MKINVLSDRDLEAAEAKLRSAAVLRPLSADDKALLGTICDELYGRRTNAARNIAGPMAAAGLRSVAKEKWAADAIQAVARAANYGQFEWYGYLGTKELDSTMINAVRSVYPGVDVMLTDSGSGTSVRVRW